MGCCSSKNADALDDSNEKGVSHAQDRVAEILEHKFKHDTSSYLPRGTKLQLSTLPSGKRVLANERHAHAFFNGLIVDADPTASPELVYIAAEELLDSMQLGALEMGLMPGDDGPLLAEKLALRAAIIGHRDDAWLLVARLNLTNGYFGQLHPDDTGLAFKALEAGAGAGHRATAVQFVREAHHLKEGVLPPAEARATQLKAAAVLNKLLDGGDKDPEVLMLKSYMLFAGHGYEKDDVESRRYAQLAADGGSADAEMELYIYTANGIGGPKDEAASVQHLFKAAEGGNSRAMANIGGMYATGSGGVAKDEALSLEWYKKAAEAGSGRAAYVLSVMYGTGEARRTIPRLRRYTSCSPASCRSVCRICTESSMAGTIWCHATDFLQLKIELTRV